MLEQQTRDRAAAFQEQRLERLEALIDAQLQRIDAREQTLAARERIIALKEELLIPAIARLADGFSFDHQQLQLSYRGTPFYISPREREIMTVLALQPGVWVPYKRIVDNIWGGGPLAPSAIPVAVNRLHGRCRAVCSDWTNIGRYGFGILIETRYGQGLRVRVP